MHTAPSPPSRTKQLVFFGILAVAFVLVSVLTVYKLSVANAYRVFEVTADTVPVPTDSARIAFGRHLVADVMACTSCHGPDLGGQVLIDSPVAVVSAPNLTTLTRDDNAWTRILRHGVDGEGRGLWLMPTRAHSILQDADLGAIVASIRALPKVARVLPQSHLRLRGNWAVATRKLRLVQTSLARTAPVQTAIAPSAEPAYGRYLARVAQCTSCHGAPAGSAAGIDTDGATDLAASNAAAKGLRPIAPSVLRDAKIFEMALKLRHPGAPFVQGQVPMPQKGFARLTKMEALALWRYFKGA